jgi:protein-disulfide isomerase
MMRIPLILLLAGIPAPAQDHPPAAPATSSPSVEERLDQVEHSQQQLLKEVAELREALEEKGEFAARRSAVARPRVFPLDVRGEPFRGHRDAKVAIVEYSDFACPYCAQYVREVYPQIETNYVQSGKVKYFFRDLPEHGHTNALVAAQAARCAGDQGRFWEMHDILFAAQPALGRTELETYAQGLGLDPEKFNACLDNQRWAEAIRRSEVGARRMEIYGTPAFLIGTISEDGNVVQATRTVIGGSLDTLKSALDELLSGPAKSLAAQASRGL